MMIEKLNQPFVLVLDVETTGLPKDYNASPENSDAWPYITQLAFAAFDLEGNEITRFCELIKPKGWEIPKEPFFINNNMSTERCEAEGVDIEYALRTLIELRKMAAFTVAHNLSFDSKILRAEMFRLGDTTEFTGQKICTMMKSVKHCGIPATSGRGLKWPSLGELHNKLFGCDFDGAHDALNDVMACKDCFFELVRIGVISLEPKEEKEAVVNQFDGM